MPDQYLASLTEADLDHPGVDPVFLAAELCAAGTWEPVAGGYRVLDAQAVQVCAVTGYCGEEPLSYPLATADIAAKTRQRMSEAALRRRRKADG